MVNTKILLFVATLLSGIAASVLIMQHHMDAAVHERAFTDQTYGDKMKEDLDRFKKQLEFGK